MQIARYETLQLGTDAGASEHRRRATPVEQVLEGELLRGNRREGRERRSTAPPAEPAPPLQSPRVDTPAPVTSGNSAIDAYLRTANATHYSPSSRLHLLA